MRLMVKSLKDLDGHYSAAEIVEVTKARYNKDRECLEVYTTETTQVILVECLAETADAIMSSLLVNGFSETPVVCFAHYEEILRKET